MTNPQTITEALPEPGSTHFWVTFDDQQTHRIDLEPLISQDSHRLLRLPRAAARVTVDPGGQALRWPGGASLLAESIQQAPHGPQPVLPVAILPATQRFRPLLPYLRHLMPGPYLHPDPIEARVVSRLLGLNLEQLNQALRHVPAPPVVALGRLHDIMTVLNEYFSSEHSRGLLRHPWTYGQNRMPGQPLFHSMLGCMTYGRPDLVEQPCMLLMTGALP